MAGNPKLELTSASPEPGLVGNYQNSQRGYLGPTLDRLASFREGTESRNFGSGKANLRGVTISPGDVPALSQCLMLEPVVLSDQKYARPSELRRVLGLSVGCGSEDSTFGASHLKNSPPGPVDELKRLRATVADTCVKASDRVRKFDEHLNKLNKFRESVPSKKQQRNELLTSERSSASTVKIGSQMHRNLPELGIQKFDDRPKNGGLNKRLRTSVADSRAESRNNGILRQPSPVTKERDPSKDTIDSDVAEEKIRRLPAAGEIWDKKMKRKRSVGSVFPRSVDNDGELKRTMHHKLNSESSMQTSDSTHSFRSGAYGGSNKLDPASSPAGSTARTTLKSELEKSVLTRDPSTGPIKERPIGKLNVKLNNREDNQPICPSPIVKGKASRTPRSGPMVAASSAVNATRVPGTLESYEQTPGLNKTPPLGGPNNKKHALSAGPSSQPITQWGGQRPQKMSRTRRTNLIPVPNHDEAQMQSEGSSPSDFAMQFSSGATNTALPSKGAANGNQNFKVKIENVPSPARFSECEESGAGENRIKEKVVGSGEVEERVANASHGIGPSAIPTKKNKIVTTEEFGDSPRRQGRNGRVSPFSRSSVSPTREKLVLVPQTKPLRNARTGSEKNGSKSGRPLKKLSDRKSFSRLSHVAKRSSPDCNGESEDDHEEILAAANLAYNSSINSCPSVFWKIVEALFSYIGPDEKSYLLEQLKLAEELCVISSQTGSNGDNVPEDYGCEDIVASDSLSRGRNGSMINGISSKDSSNQIDFVEQLHNSSLLGCSDMGKGYDISTPIYQRVLSALIVEDEIEEFEETGFGRPRTSISNSYIPNGNNSKHMDSLGFCEPMFGVQAHKNGNAHIIFCNGNTNIGGGQSAQDRLCNGELLSGDGGYVHSEVEVLVRLSRCDYSPRSLQTNNCGLSSFNCPYEQMSLEEKIVVELKSLDLFLEPVPALFDKEDDVIDQNITQLERELHNQSLKKKTRLDKIYKAIQENNDERRDPQQVAMDKLVELAYKKTLATRGSFASKHGIAKVSKQVALSFARRTLARCRKFEGSGASCFSEPALRDIVYAPPPRFDEKELFAASAVSNDTGGPVSNRGRRKEVLLDDVGGAFSRASSALGMLGGAKGKRSERDSAVTRNASAKVNRMGVSKGECKTKSKPKQKTTQLSTSISAYPSASGSGDSTNNTVNKRKDVRFMSSGNAAPVSSMDTNMDFANLPLNDIDGIDELGVDSEMGAPQDLNSWFNFEVDGLDHDSVGLEIPMDDLSELNMF